MVEKGQQLRIEPLGMNVDYGGHSQFQRGIKSLFRSHFFVSVHEETEREYVVPPLQFKQIFEPIFFFVSGKLNFHRADKIWVPFLETKSDQKISITKLVLLN